MTDNFFSLYERARNALTPSERKRFDIAIDGRRPSQIAENYRRDGIAVSEMEYRAALNEAVEEAKDAGRDQSWFQKGKPEPRGACSPLVLAMREGVGMAGRGEGTLVQGRIRKQRKGGK